MVASILGRFWLPGNMRYRRYKYHIYTNTGGGGDMLCASLRATVGLAMAGLTVWSVNHLYGPLPSTYTWGYYRVDVSSVFGI